MARRSFGARARGFGPLGVDLVGALGQLRKNRHAVGQHLREAIGDRDVGPFASLAVPQLADPERREQGRMSRQDAEVPFGAGDLHLVHALADHEPIGRDDLQIEMGRECHLCQSFIFSAFSTASSMVPTM